MYAVYTDMNWYVHFQYVDMFGDLHNYFIKLNWHV